MKLNNKNNNLNYKLTPKQIQKYSRHIVMPQIGSIGQRRLLNSLVGSRQERQSFFVLRLKVVDVLALNMIFHTKKILKMKI